MNNQIINPVHSVSATDLINTLSQFFQKNNSLTLPPNYQILKTCSGKQNMPSNQNWLFIRAASIFRKLSIQNLNLHNLLSYYGCKKDRGNRPGKKVRAYKFFILSILSDLEKMEFVSEMRVTEKGRIFMNEMCEKVKNN